MDMTPTPLTDVRGARALALLGDSVTTDHISPPATSPGAAGSALSDRAGRGAKDFNSYGARRGNHEVMMRGTFANIRLRNLLVPGVEAGDRTSARRRTGLIYDTAMRYARKARRS